GFHFGSPLTDPDNLAGITAATKAINDAGGINGRPLVIKTCSDNNDVNQATICARKAIDDSDVLSLIDVGSSYGDAYTPLLEKASLANLGDLPSGKADQNSTISFPLYGGTFTTIVSATAAIKHLDAKKIGVPYVGIPAGAQLPPFIKRIVEPMGGSVVGVQAIPITATDYSSFAAKEIADKPDVIVDGLTADMYTKFIRAVRQQGGTDIKFLASTGVFDVGQIAKLFPGDKNIYMVEQYDHTAPGYQHFLQDMDKYNKSYPNRNDGATSGWLGTYAFAQGIKALIDSGKTEPTRADFVQYLNKQTNFDVEGLTGGINFTKPNTSLGGGTPRVFNDRVWLSHVEGDKATPLNGGKPFSLFLED
ncbi:ABC transporter substrate-binding protein, partial [Pseudofrankia asymbiotica]